MTALDDAPPRRTYGGALTLAVAAQVVLALAAVRHEFFWGGGLAPLLNAFEACAMIGYVVLGALGMHRCADLAANGRVTTRNVVLGAALLATLAALSPPIVSTDVYDYVARGRVEAIHGANPYTTPPSAFPADTLTSDSPAEWQDFVMPYGPIQAWLQAGVAWLNARLGGLPLVGAMLFGLIYALCHLGSGLAILGARRAVADTAPSTCRLLVLWLWNPFVLLETVHSAHNEALCALGLALCGYGVARVSGLGTALGYAFAALAKHGVAPIAPLTLFWAVRRRRLLGYGGGVAIAAAVTAAFGWRYGWFEPGGLDWITKQTQNVGASLQALLARAFGDAASHRFVLAGQVVALGFVVWLGFRVRDAASFGAAAAAATIVFLLVAMPLFSPWYHLWWLPALAACAPPATAVRALGLLAALLPLAYLPFLATRSYGTLHEVWTWSIGLALPAAALLPETIAGTRARSVAVEP